MRVAHYIQPLTRDSMPVRHVVFDVETQLVKRAGILEQRWVCGADVAIRPSGAGWFTLIPPEVHWKPEDLWESVTARCRRKQRIVVWSHGLPFDLRVSEALRWLPEHDFALEGIVLERTAAWASFTSRRGSILFCDLLSWLPVPLATLAADMGRTRPPFDYVGAGPGELAARCITDVNLTAEAVCRMLSWLGQNQCGPFRPTGSGQSHAAWRRKFLSCRVLAHEDMTALAAERKAMWAGRCEAWRWGKIEREPMMEWDLNLAYCRVAQECKVPTYLSMRGGAMTAEQFENVNRDRAILAEVEIETEVPIVPTGVGERIIWPVGRFRTLLWDPEVKLALQHADSVQIRRTWFYGTAPALSGMASWLIEMLTDPAQRPPEPIARMLKHWARTIVGRMALRYRRWEDWGETPDLDLRLGLLFDLDTADHTDLLRIGKKVMALAELAEADSSIPAITGWVMSEARRRLWEVIEAAGRENVYYMDTDSVIVKLDGHRRLQELGPQITKAFLVHKATWSGGEIHGPRNLELDRSRRLAGVPVRAQRTGDLTFDGEVWRSLKASLARAELDHVAVLPRSFKVRSTDPRRERINNGYTLPYRLEHDEIL